MTDRLKYIPLMIHEITIYVDHNQWLKRLDTQLNESTNHYPKLVGQRIRKRYYKILGTSVINSPMYPRPLNYCMDEMKK